MRKFILMVFCLSLGWTLAAQEQQQNVVIKTTKVAGNVYMLEGQGGNIGVSTGEDGILIIDDEFAPLAEKIKAALKNLGSDKPRFLLNTHWHGDHTGGNEIFSKDATIIAQTNVRKRLSMGSTLLGEEIKAAPKDALPIITFDQSLSVFFNGEEIKVIHFPSGHTDGDSVIFFTKSNVVHAGDDFFKDRFPFVDLQSGGSVQGYIQNVGEIIAKLPADAKIIPGHGSLANLDDFKRFHQMLIETTGIVQNAMKAGKTLEQIKQSGLPDKWKDWGTGFIKTDRWIETIYKSYSVEENKSSK